MHAVKAPPGGAPAAWNAGGGAAAPAQGAPALPVPPPSLPLRQPTRDEGSIAQLLGRWRARPKDCTELNLSRRHLERLSGLDALANLEVLFVSGNRLRALTGLDANENEICTLRGSLPRLRHLSHLDLSSNALRDLPKLLARLRRLQRLRQLNLAGNPCCEEPGYRLTVVHGMPWLEVLDCHRVTDAERRQARAVVGGDVAALTVAFGRRVDAGGAWRERVAERSVLEAELSETAARVREARRAARERAEAEAYAANPDAEFWAPKASLPPPPGLLAALAAREAPQLHPGMSGAGGGARELEAAGWVATGSGSSGPGSVLSGSDVFVLTLHHSLRPPAAAVAGAASTGAGRAGGSGKLRQGGSGAAPEAAARAGAAEEPAAADAPPAMTVARRAYAPNWTISRVALRL
ncbi:hypothetical protein Rsub_08103 [Raphidocelis subcapitata]|uniref:Uncharacterized protein n=1 Tax=Raphidocelis subcapitata TaxID=307507 RepID=A0A2V0PDK9_9CHLO|nr:hypothetical protein Rsub_08103 [Raphidocelis subcapitata]|eukprot:GBF95980.1 hypothetical protein Rsub_08103 [Raphidocelis subcapitata]